MKTISREELKEKLDRKENFRLVMALAEWAYQAKIFLAVQLLFQLFATDRFHIPLLSNAVRSHCASVAPAS